MALDRAQRKIIDVLLDRPQSVKQLLVTTGYSITYLRNNLKEMVRDREIILDKERQPYLYSVSETSPELRLRRHVDQLKNQLTASELPEGSDPLIKRFRNVKKETWTDFAEYLEVLIRAVRELEKDGELIDTLEKK